MAEVPTAAGLIRPARLTRPKPRRRHVAKRVFPLVLFAALLAGAASLALSPVLAAWPDLPAELPMPIQRGLADSIIEPDWSHAPTGPIIDGIRARGVLVAAVRTYRRPAPPGEPAPLEPDNFDDAMARFIAARLGVRLTLVDVDDLAIPNASPSTQLPQSTHSAQPAVDLVLAGADAPAPVPTQSDRRSWPVQAIVGTGYNGGSGHLVTLRGSAIQQTTDLKGTPVCAQRGSPYTRALSHDYGANIKSYPSGVHAVYGFMSGECQALVEDQAVIDRLMQREEWRFYRQLPQAVAADRAPELHLAPTPAPDPVSARLIDRMARQWKVGGGLLDARERRVGDLTFEVTQLQDGLICHSS